MIKFDGLMKEAIKGDALSQYGVGLYYLNGFEVTQDKEEAVNWFMKAAEQGLDEAQINLGYAYMTGEGIDFDLERGFSWYMKAALQGNAEAQRTVGACYEEGNGVEQDSKKAFEWYLKAAEQGNSDAQYNIGHCYYKGYGVKQNLQKAFSWFEKAAEQGSHEAQYYVGGFYLNGKGGACDTDKAIYWLSKSAEGGIEFASQLLQQIKANNVSTAESPKVLDAFVRYLIESAENGNMDAQYRLGCAYNDGDPAVGEDCEEAVRYFEMAAEQGHAEAQCNLGVQMLYGNGIQQDFEKGRYWLEKAAEQGDDIAKSHLQRLSVGDYDYYNRNFSSADEWQNQYLSDEEHDIDYEDTKEEAIDDYSQPVYKNDQAKEKLFTEEEALACFFVAADIVRQEGKALLLPSAFLLTDDEEFLIYKDLIMYSLYLLGMGTDRNWDQIYIEAQDLDRLAVATAYVSNLSEIKKKYVSAFLCTIADSEADEEHYYDRYNKYHLYCRKCGLESLMFNGSMKNLLCYKMHKMNGYDFMPEPENITFEANGVEFNMIRVEGGAFEMGTDEPETFEDGATTDDAPSHKVTVDTFYIGETMVTEELWNKVMDISSEDGSSSYPMSASWYDCQKFVKRLSKLLGLNFRMPTEAEWEFAARGGKESVGYIYSGSDDIDEVAWYDGNSDVSLHEVAELEPNELGIYDMSGNLLEWCQDWFDDDYYSYSPDFKPLGPEKGETKVTRGGVCNMPDYYSRVELRFGLEPTHDKLTGLRLVMDLDVPFEFEGYENGHTETNAPRISFVDLGLPSGTKWAKYNIGASSQEQTGDYFSWGEISSKQTFVKENCKTDDMDDADLSIEDIIDCDGILTDQFDVATRLFGNKCKIPTVAQFKELCNEKYCSWKWTSINGVHGYMVTSKVSGYTDKYIFLPAAGHMGDDKVYDFGEEGYYWTSKSDGSVNANVLFFYEGDRCMSHSSRFGGQPVRPVTK